MYCDSTKKNLKSKGINKSGKKWMAQAYRNGITKYLGTFDSKEAAEESIDAFDAGQKVILRGRKYKSESGIKGISRNGKKWSARSYQNGVLKYLGAFDSKDDASHAITEFETNTSKLPSSFNHQKSHEEDQVDANTMEFPSKRLTRARCQSLTGGSTEIVDTNRIDTNSHDRHHDNDSNINSTVISKLHSDKKNSILNGIYHYGYEICAGTSIGGDTSKESSTLSSSIDLEQSSLHLHHPFISGSLPLPGPVESVLQSSLATRGKQKLRSSPKYIFQ